MQTRLPWHIGGWLLYFLYLDWAVLWSGTLEWQDMLLIVSKGTVQLAAFYLFYGLIWPRCFRAGRWPWLALAVPLGLLFLPALRYGIEELLYPGLFGFGNYFDPSLVFYLRDNIIMWSIPVAAVSAIVYLLENKFQAERERQALEIQKTQAELAFLRSQINPHFLFNTLSYLHTEAYRSDPELANSIVQLSEMLRYALRGSMEGQVRIEEEVALLQNYMAIFQKRFKGRFYATLDVQGTALSQQIEPLLLISFLENAFKHGLTNDPEHPVRFLLEVAPGTLYFSAWNKVKQQHKDPGSGIGLKNIRQRLQLLYPNRHDLVVDAKPDTFAANLRIDLEPDT